MDDFKIGIAVDADGLFVSDVLESNKDMFSDYIIIPLDNPIPEGLSHPKHVDGQWVEGKIFSLDELKSQKLSEVEQAYQIELKSSFTSSATGIVLVYDYSTDESVGYWKDLKMSIDDMPDNFFPFPITLADGTVVPHDRVQLKGVLLDIILRNAQLYGKRQSLITNTIPNATEETIASIGW